jgi:hypothetical protein
MRSALSLLVLLLLAPAAWAAPPMTEPLQLSGPTPEQIKAAYPAGADAAGEVSLACEVGADGRLSGCLADAVSPADQGFEAAALSLAPHYEFAPATMDGQVVPAATRVVIRFVPPAPPVAIRYGRTAAVLIIWIAAMAAFVLWRRKTARPATG